MLRVHAEAIENRTAPDSTATATLVFQNGAWVAGKLVRQNRPRHSARQATRHIQGRAVRLTERRDVRDIAVLQQSALNRWGCNGHTQAEDPPPPWGRASPHEKRTPRSFRWEPETLATRGLRGATGLASYPVPDAPTTEGLIAATQ
jgi:hypothetical protein